MKNTGTRKLYVVGVKYRGAWIPFTKAAFTREEGRSLIRSTRAHHPREDFHLAVYGALRAA